MSGWFASRATARMLRDLERAAKLQRKAARRRVYRACWRSFVSTVRRLWRYRRGLAPFYVTLGVLILGAVIHAEPDAARSAGLIAWVAGCGLWWGWRRRDEDGELKWSRFRRWYFLACWIAGSACLFVIAIRGAGVPMPGVLGAAALVAAIPWWVHHWPRDPAVNLDQRLVTWQEVVAGEVLPVGTNLLGIAPLSTADLDPAGAPQSKAKAVGWSARVELPHGKGTTAKIQAAAGDIAACYDLPVDAVWAEPTTDRSARAARLIVLNKRNRTHDVALYDESWAVLVDCCYPMGVFGDGTRAWRRLYKPGNGPVHELYSGDSGSGKSRGMEAAITQSVMTGLVIPFVADPQGGQSMPAWAGAQGKAAWPARGVEEIVDMLYALYRLMHSRNERLAAREWVDEDGITRVGLEYHDPLVVPDMPIVEFTLDEAHELLKIKEILALVEKLARMSRKTGLRLRLGTQYPSISDLGQSMAIRNQLVGGNIVSYRIGTRVTSGMILPDWAPNPFDIPPMTPDGKDTAGTCVAISAAPGGMRPAFQRGVWVKNAHKWADLAAERIPAFSDADRDALGDAFAHRDGARAETAAEPARDRQTIQVAEPIVVPSSRSTRDAILRFLADHGRAHTGVIADALDISRSTASMALRRLADKGLVTDVRHGVWAVPGAEENETEISA